MAKFGETEMKLFMRQITLWMLQDDVSRQDIKLLIQLSQAALQILNSTENIR
jgi:hypothetical protein